MLKIKTRVKQIERINKMNNQESQEAIKNVDVKAYMKANNISFKDVTVKTKKYYGIRDTKAEEFCEIIENINDACMIRSLKTAVNSHEKTLICQHPEDYELWKLYEVNPQTGDVIADLRKITDAKDYVESVN